jgi:phosphatidylinositol-3-phosphatase
MKPIRIICSILGFLALSLNLLAATPHSHHVVVVVEENHSFESVIGSSSMPYLNSLAAEYGLALRYYGNVHPSIGNYFMMTTGHTITTSDGWPGTVTSNNIVRELNNAGKTWHVYAEGLPSIGYIGGDRYPYVKHHDPMAYFQDVKNSAKQRANIVPFTQLETDLKHDDLPNFSFVIPDVLHDGHNGSLKAADSWLKTNIAPLLANSVFRTDGILIITFDESYDSDKTHGGGHVATIVIGPKVKRHKKTSTFFQHQSILRTVELALGLPTIGAAQNTFSFSEFF